ncbi:MAG TPA: xylulokinase [Anaeromyxobacteraceae bacterium]|nr:xylulokinase [Anaeromyxobacteraceae bacterium]
MFLGIDIGTTSTKAVLIDANQVMIASATAGYAESDPATGRNEIDPRLWLDAVRGVVGQLRHSAPRELCATTAVGLSGQMHTLVTLDRDFHPVRPAILWSDGRGEEESRLLREGVAEVGELTGVLPMPSFTAPKLLWLRRTFPVEFGRIAHVLWPKDFVRHWLTGELVTDASDAAGGQLLDERQRIWADRVLEFVGVPRERLPRLQEGTEVSGVLRPEVAADLGLPAGIPVAAGGGDAATSAVGLGCVREGRAFISLGTGAVFLAAQDAYRPQPEALLHTFAHCLPARWYRMAAMLNGASCLAWVARLCNESDIDSLLGRVAARGSAPGRILFQPYLQGERTPYNDVAARGAFIGLDAASDSVDLARAVLEGVAYSLRLGQELLAPRAEDLSFIGLVGGGARSALWSEIVASILGRPLAIVEDADCVAALGAARVSMIAMGAPLTDVAALPRVARTVEPERRWAVAYSERFGRFRKAYAALRPLT